MCDFMAGFSGSKFDAARARAKEYQTKYPLGYSYTQQPYDQYVGAAQKALPQLYAPAYQAISAQVAPEMARARNYLAANPAMGNSGLGNRLNRQILTGAYGSLANSMGQTSAGVAQGGLDLLSQLIQRRMEARYQQEQEKRNKKGGIGSTLGGLVGAGLGAIGGPALGAIGSKIGGTIAGKIG